MQRLRQHFESLARHYLVALQFFTRIPLGPPLAAWVGHSPELLRASAAHFPGIGWLVGMAACVSFAGLSVLLPDAAPATLAAALGSTIVTVLLTGAFHEDGLADVADGLGGSADAARAMEIMKDSRLGSYGTLALVLAVGFKCALLATLAARSPAAVLTALLAAHTVARYAPLVLAYRLTHVGDAAGSKSKPLADRISPHVLRIGALWCFVPLALMGLAHGALFLIAAVVACALALLAMIRLARRRLGGFTGDVLGATQQVCEIAFYLGAAVALG